MSRSRHSHAGDGRIRIPQNLVSAKFATGSERTHSRVHLAQLTGSSAFTKVDTHKHRDIVPVSLSIKHISNPSYQDNPQQLQVPGR